MTRPDPDEVLRQIQADGRGKLKVFLGYAAGVGKTYRMLQQAQWRQAEGVDVAVGYAVSHGREETQALIDDLPSVPARSYAYHGSTFEEPDVDRIIQRRPDLVVIDELAHTNAPGSRHAKRYHDVEELLAAGIDVYTTLNVQHIESLHDVVAQITGIDVRETVPDAVVEQASDIELVDLPPDELQQRMAEGRVYIPAQARQATQQFFRIGNLRALREMAMRRAARHADGQMTAYMRAHGIAGPWAATEKLLVCVSPSPLSQRLIRTAKRLADDLGVEWIAAYAETPGNTSMGAHAQAQVEENLRLAEQLGARALCLPAGDAADAIVEYAARHNVTKIIVGKPTRPRWRALFRRPFVERIIDHSGPIDVYVINSAGSEEHRQGVTSTAAAPLWGSFASAVGLVALATLVGLPVARHVELSNLVMPYLVAVLVTALYLGRAPAMVASALSVLAFDVLFVPPRFTIGVTDSQYLITFAGLLAVGVVVSSLAAKAREQARGARARAQQTTYLYELSRDLARAATLDEAMEVGVTHMASVFEAATAVLLVTEGSIVRARSSEQFPLDASEAAIAVWAVTNARSAGRGTETFAGADAIYVPMGARSTPLGVVAIVPPMGESRELGWQRMLETFANLIGSAVERIQLAEQARELHLLQETERLQTALLDSISHDLRTPLASIAGVLSSLMEANGDARRAFAPGEISSLLRTAWEQTQLLNSLVGNLLDMTRLEGGAFSLSRELHEVTDMVGAALGRLEDALGDRPVRTNLPDELPLVPVDFVLMVQALVNVIDNANKYSPAGEAITISAGVKEDDVELVVVDRGCGVAPEDRERVFEKFWHLAPGGTGLGLSISRGIVEAHGGRIKVRDADGGGTVVAILLPLSVPDAEGDEG